MPFRDGWIPVGTLLALLGFAAGQPVIAGVGFVIFVIGAGSRLWSRHLFDRVSLTRTVAERRVFVDEAVPMKIRLTNRKLLPMPWFEWRLAFDEAFAVEGVSLAAAAAPGTHWMVEKGALGWYQHQDWDVTVTADRRGFHTIGPASLRSADLLGVFPGRTDDEDVQHLIVFPKVFTLEQMGFPAERPFGERKGVNPLFEDPIRIAGTRDYRPGDPLKRIDWKATARRGELQSRVYEPWATRQLYLLVNIDTLEHAWEGYLRDDLELTVSVAASVAVWAAGSRFAVGILANGSFPDADRPIRLAPSRSRDQLTRVLEALAVIQPLSTGDLAGALEKEAGRVPVGSTLILVAAMIPAPLLAAIARFQAEGNAVHVVATTDRAAAAIPDGIAMTRVGGFKGAELFARRGAQ